MDFFAMFAFVGKSFSVSFFAFLFYCFFFPLLSIKTGLRVCVRERESVCVRERESVSSKFSGGSTSLMWSIQNSLFFNLHNCFKLKNFAPNLRSSIPFQSEFSQVVNFRFSFSFFDNG